jgi:hypothetical protein
MSFGSGWKVSPTSVPQIDLLKYSYKNSLVRVKYLYIYMLWSLLSKSML